MVFEKLKAIIVDSLVVDADQVTMDATFRDDLEADSLDLAELAMSVEEEFGLGEEFSEEELDQIKTVGDLVHFVEKRLGE